ncbi:MAG: hypothetical protein L6408_07575 [Nanoarchaeota archaeon]|nr:hypothetical protein [Nanoarchaeota archaeon]
MEEIDYMQYVEKLNSSPIFTNIAKHFDYERIGLQILRDEEVIKEFTSYNQNGKMGKVEEKLDNPELTLKIQEKTLQKMTTPQEQAWIEKNPIDAALKYKDEIEGIPFTVKLKLAKLLMGF